ncbi:MAG: hypothetical protein M9894_05910 [Planctomycetes bacterium]|nr:hypothetical protein [Planctomycetota bacterium]
MRSERRASRNRVYSLVGGLLIVVLCLAALGSLATLGRRTLDARLYPWPDRTLRALAEAQERYRLGDLDRNGVHDYAASLSDLERAGQITRTLAEGVVHGYRYAVALDGEGYVITATPDEAVVGSGALHYAIDQFHVVRAAAGVAPGPDAEVFWHPVYHDVWPGVRPEPLGEAAARADPAGRPRGDVPR